MGCQPLLQGIFPTQGSNPHSKGLLSPYPSHVCTPFSSFLDSPWLLDVLFIRSLLLFLVALDLCGHMQKASLVVEHRLWAHGLQELQCMGSALDLQALERGLSSCGAWAVGSSRTRGRTCVSCIRRWVLILCTTREVRLLDVYTFLWRLTKGHFTSVLLILLVDQNSL